MLLGYVDIYMVRDVDSRKSTSGYLITFAGGPVSWQSKLQTCVALSTTEVEYIAIAEAFKEMLWMKKKQFARLLMGIIIRREMSQKGRCKKWCGIGIE